MPKNSFVKPFKADTALKGITEIDTRDDETEYYIFGKQSSRWNRGYMTECPYFAHIDGDDLVGSMYFSTRDPFAAPLCVRGDSGAIVINKASKLVGMVIGGCDNTGIALVTPINVILKGFNDLKLTL